MVFEVSEMLYYSNRQMYTGAVSAVSEEGLLVNSGIEGMKTRTTPSAFLPDVQEVPHTSGSVSFRMNWIIL